MRPNRVLERFSTQQTAVVGWLSIDSAYLAEVVGTSGFDAVVIDCQHGMADHAQMVAMLQALSHTPAMPMVRVSENNLAEVNRALDAGAYGLICPLVNSAAEATRFARATVLSAPRAVCCTAGPITPNTPTAISWPWP
jgi:4-hydroxy-2-oxoheptanedioate aldolase